MPKKITRSPDLPGEVWRPIPSTDGWYEASCCGRIRNARARRGTAVGMVVKTWPGYLDYHNVSLRLAEGKRMRVYAHHLVAEAFHGPRDGREVNHKNRISSDNRAENLEWTTRSGNLSHYHGRPVHFLTPAEIDEAIALNGVLRHADIAAKFGVSRGAISKAIKKHSAPLRL